MLASVTLRLARFLALIAAMQILGGHWAALQSVAWVTMVIDYSKQSSLGVALEKTFDGAHPCSLCNTVSKGRSDERRNETVKLLVKFEAVLAGDFVTPGPADELFIYPTLSLKAAAIALEPPIPPPLA